MGFYSADDDDDEEDDPPDPNPALTSLNITMIEHIIDVDKDPFADPIALPVTDPALPAVKPSS